MGNLADQLKEYETVRNEVTKKKNALLQILNENKKIRDRIKTTDNNIKKGNKQTMNL